LDFRLETFDEFAIRVDEFPLLFDFSDDPALDVKRWKGIL
jgi:hypothetical protein